MARNPKPERHKQKTVKMLERWAKKTGHTMLPPIWINGTPHVAFTKKKEGRVNDNVNHPAHYIDGREHEPIDVIEDWELGYNLGQVIKYVSRAGRKGDAIEDLRKAEFYLQRQIRKGNA